MNRTVALWISCSTHLNMPLVPPRPVHDMDQSPPSPCRETHAPPTPFPPPIGSLLPTTVFHHFLFLCWASQITVLHYVIFRHRLHRQVIITSICIDITAFWSLISEQPALVRTHTRMHIDSACEGQGQSGWKTVDNVCYQQEDSEKEDCDVTERIRAEKVTWDMKFSMDTQTKGQSTLHHYPDT